MNCMKLDVVCYNLLYRSLFIWNKLSHDLNGDVRILWLVLIWDRLRLEGGCVTTSW